ncbi:MAG: hypothetical protein IPL39_17905 [Opitutaceae bacterium]|nr:hypothetical protein [Opitutaceae bacterium]
MKPVTHPPDVILRAYADLIDRFFVFIRADSQLASEPEVVRELADGTHNIGAIISSYGTWTDDAKYREVFLRPFDRKWGEESFRSEEFLDERIREHSK